MKKIKKLFGDIELSWKKIISFAIIAGVYTALMCIIPQLKYTSLNTIAVTFEVWILIGIIIIMNAKSNIDSALKCFVFFLISQPLVYLLQVPFSDLGWKLFGYYKYWFIWTILCLPMGYIGYYIKKDKWWGYLILLPVLLLTASSYNGYFRNFLFCYPYYILICIFCVVVMLIYPNVLFNNKKIKIVGTVISSLLIIGITIYDVINPPIYPVEIYTIDEKNVTTDYQVSLSDNKYGAAYIKYIESEDFYVIQLDFKKRGKTELTVVTPMSETKKYDFDIKWLTYQMKEK